MHSLRGAECEHLYNIIGIIHAHEYCDRCAYPFRCDVCCVPWVVRLGAGVGSRHVTPWAIEVGLLCGQVEYVVWDHTGIRHEKLTAPWSGWQQVVEDALRSMVFD